MRDDPCCPALARGCTEPTAANYDPEAQADDGSCVLPVGPGGEPAQPPHPPSLPTCADPGTVDGADATGAWNQGQLRPEPSRACQNGFAPVQDSDDHRKWRCASTSDPRTVQPGSDWVSAPLEVRKGLPVPRRVRADPKTVPAQLV